MKRHTKTKNYTVVKVEYFSKYGVYKKGKSFTVDFPFHKTIRLIKKVIGR